ncbi:hypothetical protein Q8A67_019470 [Cirrhinus molitorella]|uniref:Uncharacterized protein n=1 Tax=Cirrhinus molitorella TaxID=172907 RepID=A0AA88TDN6_9TELE|nr:hypothetical protein Q8A67_019470 [Cirrhinus molitorella]
MEGPKASLISPSSCFLFSDRSPPGRRRGGRSDSGTRWSESPDSTLLPPGTTASELIVTFLHNLTLFQSVPQGGQPGVQGWPYVSAQ